MKHTGNCVVCGELFSVERKPGRPTNKCEAHRGKDNPNRRRAYHLKHAYGVSEQWYKSTLEAQNHSCAICKAPHSGSRYGMLYVDHDHATGAPRGLLCQHCNHGLGKFYDNIGYLEQAIMYLREHSE